MPRYKYTLCLIRRGDEILLLNRYNAPCMGCWNGVGGKLEAGEAPTECVLREVMEETGIALQKVHFRGILSWWSGDSRIRDEDGGLYLFAAEMPKDFDFPALKPTDEGILQFKKLDWALNPANDGVVRNIPRFLPTLLSDERPHHYRQTYDQDRITDFSITPMTEEEVRACELRD